MVTGSVAMAVDPPSSTSTRIEEEIAPFRLARELLVAIPGFSNTIAELFIAETGAGSAIE